MCDVRMFTTVRRSFSKIRHSNRLNIWREMNDKLYIYIYFHWIYPKCGYGLVILRYQCRIDSACWEVKFLRKFDNGWHSGLPLSFFELDKCCVAHLPRKYIHGRCSPAVTWAESDAIWFAKWCQTAILSIDQYVLSPPYMRPHFSSLSNLHFWWELIFNSYWCWYYILFDRLTAIAVY